MRPHQAVGRERHMKDSRDATCGTKKPGYTYIKPTKPGYYWVRSVYRDLFPDGIVEIVPDGDDLRVQIIGDDYDFELIDVEAQWCGPIKEPE